MLSFILTFNLLDQHIYFYKFVNPTIYFFLSKLFFEAIYINLFNSTVRVYKLINLTTAQKYHYPKLSIRTI